jgi:DNA repair protein RadA/Sms
VSTVRTRGGSGKTVFVCAECGALAPKWAGQCGECGAWNSLTEEVERRAPAGRRAGFAAAAGAGGSRALAEISPTDEARIPTAIGELDRALGGGLVRGSVVLIGGDPGIGKSTLLLQAMSTLAAAQATLYVTGEESLQQVSLRARRLGIDPKPLRVLAETDVDAVVTEAAKVKPGVMVIDSIQTMYCPELQAAPGAVSQVRECAARLVQYAKQTGCALFLVGHVTKEGMLAGPRVLEHMVDTVLYFEGDAGSRYRVVRAVKNRFGAVNEVGVFAMTEHGLKGVSNPSAIFVSRHETPVAGSVVTVMREGSRPLLLEVQVLVAESHAPSPRRVAVGLDQNRLAMLLAVLQRHSGVAMFDQDVFVNIVGGVRISETAADLPVALAALSSLRNRPVPGDTVVFGEIGLAGEIRPVPNGQERLKEAAQHGFRRAIVPKANRIKGSAVSAIEIISVQRLEDAIAHL